jgi:hypothetical protein
MRLQGSEGPDWDLRNNVALLVRQRLNSSACAGLRGLWMAVLRCDAGVGRHCTPLPQFAIADEVAAATLRTSAVREFAPIFSVCALAGRSIARRQQSMTLSTEAAAAGVQPCTAEACFEQKRPRREAG